MKSERRRTNRDGEHELHADALTAGVLTGQFVRQGGDEGALAFFSEVVAQCRNCRHIVKAQECRLYRRPIECWDGRACRSYEAGAKKPAFAVHATGDSMARKAQKEASNVAI